MTLSGSGLVHLFLSESPKIVLDSFTSYIMIRVGPAGWGYKGDDFAFVSKWKWSPHLCWPPPLSRGGSLTNDLHHESSCGGNGADNNNNGDSTYERWNGSNADDKIAMDTEDENDDGWWCRCWMAKKMSGERMRKESGHLLCPKHWQSWWIWCVCCWW